MCSQSSSCQALKKQFQAKRFLFNDTSTNSFQSLQWTNNKWIFFAYRLFMAAYVLGWFLYAYISSFELRQTQLLSNWTEGLMVVYFLYAFFVSIHALTRRKQDVTDREDKLPWYLILNWLLQTVATASAFEISIFYAVVIAPGRTLAENLHPVTLHLHLVNSILFIIDLFMISFPTRILHFIYTVCYGVLYTIFLVILFVTNYNTAVYPALDFKNTPGTAALWTVLAVAVLPLILQIVAFFLYQLRSFIARKTVLKNINSPTKNDKGSMELGETNPTFEN